MKLLRRLLSPFLLIFTALCVLVVMYVGLRGVTSSWQWGVLLVSAGLVWSLPAIHWASENEEFSAQQLHLQRLAFGSMSILSWLFVLTVLRDLAFCALYFPLGSETAWAFFLSTGGTVLFGAALGLTLFGAWRALRGPRIKQVLVPIQGLPEKLSGLKIAQISDLHIGPTIGRAYVESLVAMVEKIQPDLTVLTGDIVDGNLRDLKDAVSPLARLSPKGRVFYCPGNHEYYWTIDQWLSEFSELGATVLLNSGTQFTHGAHTIWVGGVSDRAATSLNQAGPSPTAAMHGGESADFRLLLAHRPEGVTEAARAGFQLQLSGHTHGGQFFPWTFAARLAHKFFLGLMQSEGMWIYVSPGTGSWGPPQRVGTTPELTVITLKATERK